jgi:hypothetical protein
MNRSCHSRAVDKVDGIGAQADEKKCCQWEVVRGKVDPMNGNVRRIGQEGARHAEAQK